MSILVVEDDAAILETLGMVLDAFHYDHVLLDQAEQVIPELKRQWPELILLDLTLKTVRGEEVLQSIQKEFGQVPEIIVLSAAHELSQRVAQMPGVRFLRKPYTIESLVGLIDQVFKKKGAA
ncbi:MAG: response regulator [Bdellovibrionia bacterium]